MHLISAVSRRDDGKKKKQNAITSQDYDRAHKWLKEIEKDMPRVISRLEKNELECLRIDMQELIQKRKTMKRADVIEYFISAYRLRAIEEVLNVLGKIHFYQEDICGNLIF